MKKRENILVIGGYDATGGAGVLADIKTIEQHKCYGMAVITANTVQTEEEVYEVNPVNENLLFRQLDVLLSHYFFKTVKIGLVPSIALLEKIIFKLKSHHAQIKIIWDPVLASSSEKVFLDYIPLASLSNLLKNIYIITPNYMEITKLADNKKALEAAAKLAQQTRVYLKGGHNPEMPGKDFLFYNNKVYPLNPKNKRPVYPKHGSGCVFASSLAANIAKGYPLLKACLRSKRYIERVLGSNASLLGYHKF